jgi:2-oxoglutarate dehydrogenase E2 component (dihydrolipoamide succinyltransferase)
MAIEIKVPSPGESITQVQVAKWLVTDGALVEKDQEIVEIDSDKASFPIASPEAGVVKMMAQEGDTLAVGAVIAVVDPEASAAEPVLNEVRPQNPVTAPETPHNSTPPPVHPVTAPQPHISPLARKIMEEKKINIPDISAAFPGKRITRKELEAFAAMKKSTPSPIGFTGSREVERKKLTMLRLKLAERLVSVKNETAMLTTFNEINMQAALKIKERYNDLFKERHGVSVGLMSFFTKAVTLALKDFPQVNSMIDGDELITPNYIDIGIAVSAPKGLVVPVLRNAEMMSMAEIEQMIKALAVKARDNKITIDDMKGGTFTITNGGVFGSLMSTPILNPPQSAILGMHKIQERPIAVNGNVVIAPMMYVALSYDHRVIDGRESVGFLVKVKELIEEPARMLTEGIDPIRLLLDL